MDRLDRFLLLRVLTMPPQERQSRPPTHRRTGREGASTRCQRCNTHLTHLLAAAPGGRFRAQEPSQFRGAGYQ
jgi:hypothetical protein